MKTLLVKTYYLEMLEAFGEEVPPPRSDLIVEHLHRPSLSFYRALYGEVGKDWGWFDRLLMPDEKLAAVLRDPRVEVHLLRAGERLAGYAELDRRVEGEIELAYFGLTPEYIGQRLGKYLLSWAVRRAWSYGPSRVWVHTCAWDHPAALPAYQRAGFRLYGEGLVKQSVPDGVNASSARPPDPPRPAD